MMAVYNFTQSFLELFGRDIRVIGLEEFFEVGSLMLNDQL